MTFSIADPKRQYHPDQALGWLSLPPFQASTTQPRHWQSGTRPKPQFELPPPLGEGGGNVRDHRHGAIPPDHDQQISTGSVERPRRKRGDGGDSPPASRCYERCP